LDRAQPGSRDRCHAGGTGSGGRDGHQQHQDGDNFYVVERGVFDAFVDDKTLRAGGGTTDGVLWSLDMETFQRRVLTAAFRHRQKYEAFLAAVPLLAELTQYERQNVADAIREREFSDGAPILMQGDVGNEMFFIEEGGVKVMRRGADNGLETQVNQLGKGDYFGELALITKQPRAASCYAVGPTKVCVLHPDQFASDAPHLLSKPGQSSRSSKERPRPSEAEG
uniref:Cyclic nucleotide-binding domain-containing protein n=1 Tax=Macrostomum lignano TaxID=282301 RepID=A0A1I8JPH0_9PLAT